MHAVRAPNVQRSGKRSQTIFSVQYSHLAATVDSCFLRRSPASFLTVVVHLYPAIPPAVSQALYVSVVLLR